MLSICSRVRPRSRPVVDDHGGWSRVDHSHSQVFWPRFQDFCLVTAGVRCAILLDSRRAPRGSPPLADVLRELQEDCHSDGSTPGDCDGHADSIASLGLLRLEGSCFLVNRSMLAHRLGQAVAFPDPHPDAAPAPPMPPRGRVAATQPVAEGSSLAVQGGEANIDKRAVIPAVQLTPGAFDHSPSSAWAAPGQGLDCAFVDVRKSLTGPVVRTDALTPQLYAALRSAFGVAAGDLRAGVVVGVQAATSADPPPRSSTQSEASVAAASFRDQEKGGNFSEPPSEGALWLRDWKRKDLALDSRGLSESLGDVGLPGFAGWLLEYPVIYCCSSLSRSEQRSDDGGGAEAGHAGNCLALVPLTVYSLRLGVEYEPSSLPRESNPSYFEAFSFSVPQTVCCLGETARDDGDDDDDGAGHGAGGDRGRAVVASLNHLVDVFLERFERRLASHRNHSAGCCERHQQWLERLSVTKRTETLDQVAL
ncbi:unnamed protein product [Laminaria digitata]